MPIKELGKLIGTFSSLVVVFTLAWICPSKATAGIICPDYLEQLRLSQVEIALSAKLPSLRPIPAEMADVPGCYKLSFRVGSMSQGRCLQRVLNEGGINSRAISKGTYNCQDFVDPRNAGRILWDHAQCSIAIDPISGKQIPPWSPCVSSCDHFKIAGHLGSVNLIV